jgi:alkylation response protein AidB-like acyl-CoA dehydrogenase
MEWYQTEDRVKFSETADKYAAWALENVDAEGAYKRAGADDFNWEMVRQAGMAGFLGCRIPEDLGGVDLDCLGRTVVLERMARGLAGPAAVVAMHWAGLGALTGPGVKDRERVREWMAKVTEKADAEKPMLCGPAVPAAVVDKDDSPAPDAVESKGGIKISGEFVCPLHPALLDRVVMAVPGPPGESRLLWVPGNDLATHCTESHPGSGLYEMPISRLRLKDHDDHAGEVLAVGEEADVAIAAMRRGLYMGLSAVMAGNVSAAADYAWQYAGERVQTGRPIIEHQDLRRALESMKITVEAARATVYSAAALTAPPEAVERARRAYVFAGSSCETVCLDAIQCLGGYGYMKDYGLERRLRDLKTMQLILGSHALDWIGESW